MDALLSGMSIGAVGAAFIAAVASVLGLVISKENKISDFRQAWIDALRGELTSYLSSINAIADASQLKYESYDEKVAKLSSQYAVLNTANFMISLRLNPEEQDVQKILNCMSDFQGILSAEKVDLGELRRVERCFLLSSKALLKREWLRVKRGELAFRLVKYFTMCVIGAIMLYAVFTNWKGYRPEVPSVSEIAVPSGIHDVSGKYLTNEVKGK
jgi:hypothetical protein